MKGVLSRILKIQAKTEESASCVPGACIGCCHHSQRKVVWVAHLCLDLCDTIWCRDATVCDQTLVMPIPSLNHSSLLTFAPLRRSIAAIPACPSSFAMSKVVRPSCIGHKDAPSNDRASRGCVPNIVDKMTSCAYTSRPTHKYLHIHTHIHTCHT